MQELDDECSDGMDAPHAEEEGSDLEVASDMSDHDGYFPQAAASENRSFASTYWRPERTDRNANLSVIDER